ncbi:MAG: TIGR02594 family protein, partial [Hyphomicrobium denitrificans]|nr:TIGR02594 family protein [Hyphomicrobium denitrificans]
FLLGDTNGKLYLLGGNQGDAVTVASFDKARLLGLRWPKENVEAASKGDDAIFSRALAHVLEMEGGFSNDPYDPGGPTNRGITLEVYAKFRKETVEDGTRARLIAELKRIPDATVTAIYRQRYFDPASCPVFTAPLALMHFDAAVNHGVGAAIRMLQGVAGVTVDGEIGPETLAAISTQSLADLLDDYAETRRARYRALPHFWRFGRGWLKRVDATLALARTWAAADATNRGLLEPQQIAKGEIKMGEKSKTEISSSDDSKWWLNSKTMWGTLITAAATVIPVLGPAVGIVLPADLITSFGDQVMTAAQALAGLFGTALAIYGRLKADTPLALRKN